jgi:DNA-3-methyladenine glycosylase
MKRPFFEQPPEIIAPLLLGKILCSQTTAGWLCGRIVEVEAYLGPHALPPDPAAHSFRGITERNRVMFGQSGHAYVYFIYGMYFCVNVTCEPIGQAGCILIRALEPLQGRDAMIANRKLPTKTADANLTRGPGRLCQALGITRPIHNGLDLLDPESALQLRQDRFKVDEVEITARIGIRQAADLPLRFSIANHNCVSKPTALRIRKPV